MQAPTTSFPAYPPPATQEFMWNAQIPPPPIISLNAAAPEPAPTPMQAKPTPSEPDEKRQGNKIFTIFSQ